MKIATLYSQLNGTAEQEHEPRNSLRQTRNKTSNLKPFGHLLHLNTSPP